MNFKRRTKVVKMKRDFRSAVDILISGTPRRKPIKMKDSTFYNLLTKCDKITKGMYTAPSGRVVEFK